MEHQSAQASPLTREILARKIVHAVVGCALGALAFAPRRIGVPLILLLAGYKLVAEMVRLRRADRRGDPFLGGGAMFREHEQRFASGAFFLVLGVAIVILGFPPSIAALGILVMALADPAAEIVGRGLPMVRIRGKSLGGSAAFFAVGVAIVATLGYPVDCRGLLVILAGTAAEALSGLWGRVRIDDNLVIPLATAATAQALSL
ncbi:MAG: hypothetical protein SF069_17925 [Phycisphaerae bacterium]|nr:hypothetical protein [Phycisphaerae bacterium]